MKSNFKFYIFLCVAFLLFVGALIGYKYAIETGNDDTPTSQASSDSQQIKNALRLEDFLEFSVGVSTREEVYSKVGKPHSYIGSGYIGDRYFTEDGYDVVVYFYSNNIDEDFYEYKLEQIRTLNPDDSYTIIKE